MSWGNELLTVAQAYQSDREAESTGIRELDLMESAGGAVARFIQGRWSPRPISVLCGPGNNGGGRFRCSEAFARERMGRTLILDWE